MGALRAAEFLGQGSGDPHPAAAQFPWPGVEGLGGEGLPPWSWTAVGQPHPGGPQEEPGSQINA